MWRTAVDINPISWRINLASLIGVPHACQISGVSAGNIRLFNDLWCVLAGRGSYSGPGGWNYPDSLEVGNWHRGKKMPDVEGRAHFSL
eukprot:SAG31_NODE_1258_length_9078_cov_12.076512_2_plen_88_part_00